MFVLCKAYGGSTMYGLSTPDSDIDIRGVIAYDDISNVVGLGASPDVRNQPKVSTPGSEDTVLRDFRTYLFLLRKANVEAIELLYNSIWVIDSPFWYTVQSFRHKLIGSEQLHNTLQSYMQGELGRANGDKPGKMGFKRAAAIAQYGFSPQNFAHYFRLAMCGSVFFQEDVFPININLPEYQTTYDLVKSIKLTPEKHSKEELNELSAKVAVDLQASYAKRVCDHQFCETTANELCFNLYYPILTRFANQKRVFGRIL